MEGGTVTNGSFVGTLKEYTASDRTVTLDNTKFKVGSEIKEDEVTGLLKGLREGRSRQKRFLWIGRH